MKRYVIVLIFLLLSTLVFANGGSEGAPQEITFWLMPNAPDEIHLAWLDEKAAEFEAETGIKVNTEIVGWGDAWTRISTAVATGEGVDVFQVGTTWNPQFAATTGLAEINLGDFGSASDFMAANLASTEYQGKYYGVPWFAETRALFYNKDMFDQAGVQPPQTYDELVEVGKAITGTFGEGSAIAMAGTNAWDLIHNWAIILWANGGELLNTQNTQALLNSQAGVTSMQWYVDLLREGLAADAVAEYNQPQADSAFINENVAMAFMGPWNITNIADENPDLNYGVVEPPRGTEGRASFSGGSNLVILEASPNKDAAVKWINFLLREDNLLEYTQDLTKFLPPLKAAFSDSYYQEGVWPTFETTLSYATAYPALGVWGDIENAVVENFRNILSSYVNGDYDDSTVTTYLDDAAEKVNAALKNE